MCDVIEKRAYKISEEMIYKKSCEFAVYMLKKGLPLNEIVEVCELPLEKIKELSFQLKNETA